MTAERAPSGGKARYWVGWAISALVAVFLLVDPIMKLLALPVVVQSGATLGFVGAGIARVLGTVLLVCVLAYAVPRTSVLGAVLLTGYLGGAVATQLRVAAPIFGSVLFPVYFGILLWGGLWLRDERVRDLVPLMGRRADT